MSSVVNAVRELALAPSSLVAIEVPTDPIGEWGCEQWLIGVGGSWVSWARWAVNAAMNQGHSVHIWTWPWTQWLASGKQSRFFLSLPFPICNVETTHWSTHENSKGRQVGQRAEWFPPSLSGALRIQWHVLGALKTPGGNPPHPSPFNGPYSSLGSKLAPLVLLSLQ